ncbi:hypothetical protein ACLBKT_16170 [Erythrobacter sp. W302b]|uniref:hypothetical protein n=1 Tax=Erythrobacter sp. W302b TaxID=3389874 RepID=UPI00396B0EA3
MSAPIPRILLAIFGGYACAALGVAAVGAVVPGSADALLAAVLLAFPLWVALVVWVFAARDVRRVAVVMAGACAVCAAIIFALPVAGPVS